MEEQIILYVCPNCGNAEMICTMVAWMGNKEDDPNTVSCPNCEWQGKPNELKEQIKKGMIN